MKYEVEVVITVETDDDMKAWDTVESWLENAGAFELGLNDNAEVEFEMVGVKDTPPV